MPRNINAILKDLPTDRRRKVQRRVKQLIAEEMALQELRKARKLTQIKLAQKLGVTQDTVSRLEKRSDLLLSTLTRTIEAMGGRLSLVAEFEDRQPIVLSGFGHASAEASRADRRSDRRRSLNR
jgi:transcriptional regulator with XRE-family HTH domain